MGTPWPENFSGDRRNWAITEELIRGREFTNQLHILLGRPPPLIGHGRGGDTADDLVVKILRSFTEALALVNYGGAGESEEVASRVPVCNNSRLNSPPPDNGGRRSEDSGESCKSPALKARRGSYKRRRTVHTWTKTTSTLMDDGHAWRKYGQKVILNAKYPRSYYRCTHKFDQGCQATKQVQKTEGEAAPYQITYNGHHTCDSPRNLLRGAPHHLFLGEDVDPARPRRTNSRDDEDSSNSILLSFQSQPHVNRPHQDQDQDQDRDHDHPFLSSFRPTLIKQDYDNSGRRGPILCGDPIRSNALNDQSMPSDHHTCLLSHDLEALEPYDQGDVISRTASTHSLDMDLMVGSVDFSNDILQFDF
uniref:WRKY transcription factor 53 n=1 Tax=Santalum album TaxID=35974 RepID=A0A650C310_SANAL|nr:WRKY transcription factor 53 [Santalum album]